MKPRLKDIISKASAKPSVYPLLAFLIPLVIRAVPEIIMGPYIVGFDTLSYYVPNTLSWLHNGVGFWNFLAVAPLFYILLMGITSVGVPIVISLKVLPPLLLGLLGIAVYFYANKTLSWSSKKSLLVVLFATLYFVALRISWDMLRSELALIFFFITLILIKKGGNPIRNGVLLSLAMISVVFAHQLVAVIMFAVILATVLSLYFDKKIVELRKLIVCTVPAAFSFLLIVYANYVATPQFSIVNGFLGQNSTGFMSLYGFASYPDFVVNTLGFLVFCYLPLVPLLVLGAKRVKNTLQLKAWIAWILFSLLLVLVSPNTLFPVFPYRWTLLLTYPLAFFAAEGFSRIKLTTNRVFAGLIIAVFSLSLMALPNDLIFRNYDQFPLYVPRSMLENSVTLSDCQNTVNALHWVKDNLPTNARLLVHDAFYGWALLTLDKCQLIQYGYGDPATFAQELVENGSSYNLYLIWWVNGSGWHGQPTVASVFKPVYESGKIVVYVYDNGAHQNVYY
jgi:hypothetical protein